MKDGYSFLTSVSALNRINVLRQSIQANVPALWVANQGLTAVELHDLEQRVMQRVSTNKVDLLIPNIEDADVEHVQNGIRIARGIAHLSKHKESIEECPVKGAMEDVCVKLLRND